MRAQSFFSTILALVLITLAGCQDQTETTVIQKPNIIYILADDLGYGDVSANNPSSKIKTPAIDQLAQSGMRFTDAHSPSAVCSPTRYGVLTGRYSWRSRLKSGVTWSWDAPLISSQQTTVASFLKKHEYHTACVGKWHLGLGWQQNDDETFDITKPLSEGPNDLGFDYFFGITASLDIPPYIYIENNESTTQEIDSIDKMEGMKFWRAGQVGSDFSHEGCLPKLTEKAVAYIDKQATTNQPFFLYFPLPAPHTPILPTEPFRGKSNLNPYGDFVIMVDDVVAQITSALKKNNIWENSLVIFTSDNGCSPMANIPELDSMGHQPSHIFRGHKADIFEGGHRVPFLASYPQLIPAGSTCEQTICLTDLLATAADLQNDSLASHEGVDSYSMLRLLNGSRIDQPTREATVHHSINGSYAIRQDQWKLIFCPGSGGWSDPRPAAARQQNLPPIQLYDLANDPGEQNNIASEQPEIVNSLTGIMEGYIEKGRSTPGVVQGNDTPTSLLFAEEKFQ